MNKITAVILTVGSMFTAWTASAQRPGGAAGSDDLVSQMMAFDADKDGQLSRAEVTDERLQRLFARADTNNDGIVTKDELTTLATKEHVEDRGGPGGFGGGPGGPRGPMMGMPRPGEVLPSMARQRLNVTKKQAAQLDTLQKDVDAKLAKILSADQVAQLKQMSERGPGGRGGPGGPGGGPGGPGGFGPPPGGGPGGFGPPPGGGPGGPPPGGRDFD